MKTEILICFPFLTRGITADSLTPALHGGDVLRAVRRTRDIGEALANTSTDLQCIAQLGAMGFITDLAMWEDLSACIFVYRGERTLQNDEIQVAYKFARQTLESFHAVLSQNGLTSRGWMQ